MTTFSAITTDANGTETVLAHTLLQGHVSGTVVSVGEASESILSLLGIHLMASWHGMYYGTRIEQAISEAGAA